MSYTVSVSVKSQRLKGEMHKFLLDVYRPWHSVAGYAGESDFEGPLIDLADGDKCTLGFRYHNGVQPERAYVFALIRWVALRVGRVKAAFRGEGLTFPKAVPYWVYDGSETFPILVDTRWKFDPALEPYFYNELGFALSARLARELAWYNLPEGTYESVTAASAAEDLGSDALRNLFIEAGLPGAQKMLASMKAEIARLDMLWSER